MLFCAIPVKGGRGLQCGIKLDCHLNYNSFRKLVENSLNGNIGAEFRRSKIQGEAIENEISDGAPLPKRATLIGQKFLISPPEIEHDF